MKKLVFSVFALVLLLTCVLSASAEVAVDDESYYAKFRDKGITINVCNWGEYISDGSEDSMDVVKEFEEISGINVNYVFFETNEDLYTKITHGGSQYDIIIPSDYMIARFINEGLLEKLDYDKIPNFKYIDEKYRNPDFDPTQEYSVPYTWGMVGLVYNTKYVTAEEASSWDVLWNEKYKGKVLMFGNSRDAFAVALRRLGYSMNTSDPDELMEASASLTEQKNVNQMYAMDQTFDKMAEENAYAAPYYAGDCATMMDRNDALAFSYPKEGVNQFIDSICIPTGSENKEAAEAFINFLCETDVAVANCEYIQYFTPHTEAAEILGFDERIAPTDEALENAETFIMLPDEANALMESEWVKVLSTTAAEQSTSTLYTMIIILALVLIIFLILYVIRKRKKKNVNY